MSAHVNSKTSIAWRASESSLCRCPSLTTGSRANTQHAHGVGIVKPPAGYRNNGGYSTSACCCWFLLLWIEYILTTNMVDTSNGQQWLVIMVMVAIAGFLRGRFCLRAAGLLLLFPLSNFGWWLYHVVSSLSLLALYMRFLFQHLTTLSIRCN